MNNFNPAPNKHLKQTWINPMPARKKPFEPTLNKHLKAATEKSKKLSQILNQPQTNVLNQT